MRHMFFCLHHSDAPKLRHIALQKRLFKMAPLELLNRARNQKSQWDLRRADDLLVAGCAPCPRAFHVTFSLDYG